MKELSGRDNLEAMKSLTAEFLVNRAGRKTAAVVPMALWKQMVSAMEELEDIRAYDRAKKRATDSIPLEEALAQLRGGKVR